MEEEIATNPLSVEQLEKSIPEVTEFLLVLGTKVNVEYGWACNLPIDQLWQTKQMDLSHLQEFIEKSRKSGILELGASDLHVSDIEGHWSFTLCHESDFHFVSSDRKLLEGVATKWHRMGFSVMVSSYTAVQAPRE
ncbi:MAG TPA: hypothetical protein VLM42_15155 [Bryobacteraceae bacterium]|nr:hypothetical protein [Bryobacteraceae bacterium]